MARSKLKRCLSCDKYGLETNCDICGRLMEVVAPLKYSPEDPQGNRRRKRLDAGSKEWIESLPTTKKEGDVNE
ncbi:MAG: nucleolar RNA-binding Nop10p family protein [Candidatus Thalassarchaeaceae archaeon]|jgi:rRNA maturation protein Nop10|tara:strand:- start:403 stop:621 length:219 start_codon:yes stop_codon:yes gene_type:complete